MVIALSRNFFCQVSLSSYLLVEPLARVEDVAEIAAVVVGEGIVLLPVVEAQHPVRELLVAAGRHNAVEHAVARLLVGHGIGGIAGAVLMHDGRSLDRLVDEEHGGGQHDAAAGDDADARPELLRFLLLLRFFRRKLLFSLLGGVLLQQQAGLALRALLAGLLVAAGPPRVRILRALGGGLFAGGFFAGGFFTGGLLGSRLFRGGRFLGGVLFVQRFPAHRAQLGAVGQLGPAKWTVHRQLLSLSAERSAAL